MKPKIEANISNNAEYAMRLTVSGYIGNDVTLLDAADPESPITTARAIMRMMMMMMTGMRVNLV